MGTARAPVTGSGLWPACRLSVSNWRDRGAAMASSSKVRPILAAAALVEDEKNRASGARFPFKKTAPSRRGFDFRPFRSAEPDRHVDLVALALYQKRDAAARAVHQAPQLVDRLHRLVVESENDVARLNSRPRRGTFGFLHEQAAFGFDLLAFFVGKRAQRQAELARLRLGLALGFCDFLRRGLAEGGVQLPRFALAPDLQAHRRSRPGLADDTGQVD